MRIAQLVETLNAGGAERLALGIADALARRGHSSHFIVMRPGGRLESQVHDDVGFHCLGLKRDGESLGLGSLRSLYPVFRRLQAVIRSQGIQVMQTHLPLANYYGLGLRLRDGFDFFPTIHNNQEFAYGLATGSSRSWLRRRAYREMVKRSAGMIAVSGPVRQAMCQELELSDDQSRGVAVVSNGVALPELPLDDEKAAVRAEFGLLAGTVVLVAVGRLSEQKNFQELIAGLSGLGSEVGAWQCVIAGEGLLHDDLAARIKVAGLEDRIQLLGHVDHIDRLLMAADCFCMTSRWEGLPLALLEAMAMGKPVVAGAIDGVREVVTGDREGLLYEPGDIPGLTRNLRLMVAAPSARQTMGTAARTQIRENFNFENTVDALEELYRNGQKQEKSR